MFFSIYTAGISTFKAAKPFVELLLQQVCTLDCMYSRCEWVGHRPQRADPDLAGPTHSGPAL